MNTFPREALENALRMLAASYPCEVANLVAIKEEDAVELLRELIVASKFCGFEDEYAHLAESLRIRLDVSPNELGVVNQLTSDESTRYARVCDRLVSSLQKTSK